MVAGYDVVKQPRQLRRTIGLTGQYASVDEKLSGRENLYMIGRLLDLPRKQAKARADELLERFSLTEAAKRACMEYSGGMRRFDLAASMIGSPAVLYLDEPTTGLDPRTRNEVWDEVQRMVAEGATVLLTTQYMEEAEQLAKELTVIDRGRIIARGGVDELKAKVGGRTLQIRPSDPAELAAMAQAIREAGLDGIARRAGRPRRGAAVRADPQRRATDRRHRPAGRPRLLPRPCLHRPAQPRRGVPRDHRRQGRPPLRPGSPGGRRMSTTTLTPAPAGSADTTPARPVAEEGRIGLRANLRHIGALARRNLLQIKKDPESMFDVLLMPIIFTLLFVYVFGGSVGGSLGGNRQDYLNYLVPGLMAMMGMNIAMAVGTGVNDDFRKGVMDRFRTMPIARSSVLIAKIVVELGRMMVAIVILLAMGFALGMTLGTSVLGLLGAVALSAVFGAAIMWIFIVLGLAMKTAQAVQGMGMLVLMPLQFGSSIFAPPTTMPGWLQTFTDYNPLSNLADAVRGLMMGGPVADSVWVTLAWAAAITLVMAPLAVSKFRKKA